MAFNRGEYLKFEFNKVWTSILGKSDDYFSYMTNTNFDMLKVALSNINNIITYNSTIQLVDFIVQIFSLSVIEKNDLLTQVEKTNPNANGYDIIYSGNVKIISEIKCNFPINGGKRFGGAQKKGLDKDLKILFNGKQGLNYDDLKEYYKFLGIYRFNSNTDEAVKHYLSHLPQNYTGLVELFNKNTVLNKNKVFVIMLNTPL